MRSLIGPPIVRLRRRRLQQLVNGYKPDLIHAMRIPFEGMAAAWLTGPPLVISVWGLDFTMCASRNRWMGVATRLALQRCEALHCDCHRDERLARTWGYPDDRPVWVLPGNGGVDDSVFGPGPSHFFARLGIPDTARLIIDPRGTREYVSTDFYSEALPAILGQLPDVHVACPGKAGDPHMNALVDRHGLRGRVHLLPLLQHHEMAELFRAARVSVSLSTHDGTPNTLLEAMACGALPVVGDVESVREWVTDGSNGLVVDPAHRSAVAAALMRALTDDDLLQTARERNRAIVSERARYGSSIVKIAANYESIIQSRRRRVAGSVR